MKPNVLVSALVLSTGGLLLAGCGSPSHQSSGKPPHSSHSHSKTSSTPSVTSSTSSSPSSPSGSGTPTSSSTSPSITNLQSSTVSASPPAPPGAGSYSELQVKLDSVQPEGTATTTGTPLNLYLLKITVTNPTSSVISIALNDFTVSPLSHPGTYSWNDYVTTGITSSNSLFPFPLYPRSPRATVLNAFPSQSYTGLVTIQVPSASKYGLMWNQSGTTNALATFTP